MQGIIIVLGALGLIGYIVTFIGKKMARKSMKNAIDQVVEESEKLLAPCSVEVLRDNSAETDGVRKFLFAFSLNNGEKVSVDDGKTITFTTHLKNKVLVGYGRGNIGGLSRNPCLDAPFKFEAVEGGTVRLVSKPDFDYTGGVG